MARGRKPVPKVAPYKMCGYSATHAFPFHVVGMLEGESRYVTVGIGREKIDNLLEVLTTARDRYDKEKGVLIENNEVQHRDNEVGASLTGEDVT